MKSATTTTTLLIILLQAVSVVAAGFSPAQGGANVNELTRGQVADPAEAETLCGALGVMEVPDGADPYTVRACKEHPSVLDDDGDGGSTSSSSSSLSIAKRACWTGTPAMGCSKRHWCYRACGNGRKPGAWCWTTLRSPYGPWKACRVDGDCSQSDPCSGLGCDQCGCGC